jgi:hypothetical protein
VLQRNLDVSKQMAELSAGPEGKVLEEWTKVTVSSLSVGWMGEGRNSEIEGPRARGGLFIGIGDPHLPLTYCVIH